MLKFTLQLGRVRNYRCECRSPVPACVQVSSVRKYFGASRQRVYSWRTRAQSGDNEDTRTEGSKPQPGASATASGERSSRNLLTSLTLGRSVSSVDVDQGVDAEVPVKIPPPNKVLDNVVFVGTTLLATGIGYIAHPKLIEWTVIVWNLKPQEAGDDFEAGFFAMISILYGLLVGNTFLFAFERQINIMQELYNEVFALELLLQHVYVAIPSTSLRRQIAMKMRLYVVDELYHPVDMVSPFEPESPFMGVVSLLASIKKKGSDTEGLVKALERLADAQSRRSAVAGQLMPLAHWVFLHSLEIIFMLTLLSFEASTTATSADSVVMPSQERQFAFASLVGMITLNSQVLHDLADPIDGLYSFRDAMDDRLRYTERLINSMIEEGKPGSKVEAGVPRHIADIQRLGLIEVGIAKPEPNDVKRRRGRLLRPAAPLPTAWSPPPPTLYDTLDNKGAEPTSSPELN